MDSLWTPRISYHMMDCAMKQSTHQFHKKIFKYVFINMYTNIYVPILYATKMTQNKNDSINSYYWQ